MKIQNIAFGLNALLLFGAFACGSKHDSKSASPAPAAALGADAGDGETEGPDDDVKTPSEKGLFQVEVNWSPNLEAGTLDNSALVHFHGADGSHVPAVLKSFTLYHTTMGHGSIKTDAITMTEEDPGHWLVKNIYFSMPGAKTSWVVDIVADLNGQTDKARVVIDADVR